MTTAFSVQQQLFARLVLDVAYIGTRKESTDQFHLNAIPPGTAFRPGVYRSPRCRFELLRGPDLGDHPGPALPCTNIMDPLCDAAVRGFNTLMMLRTSPR